MGKFDGYNFTLDEPTPRLRYVGDKHPITSDVVLRQDSLGYRYARITIARNFPNHPSLKELVEREEGRWTTH